ncbi:neurofilament medium polypeptide-like [Lineus longissimus]|uniref:neurofilament medium polypeptide-like n=1 Tax=Lineus longissimus TaxID=88925 RepID=UPI00315C72B1
MNKNDGEEVALVLVESEPEVRVLTPSSLKPVPGDIIRRSKEVKKQFTEPQDLNLDIIGKLLTLSPPKTEEELKVLESALEKEEEVNLVQANMADALGGRAWELVTEERACSGERDDAMPGSVSDIRSPRVTTCRLLKLDIDAERKKLGNKSIEKLRKVEGKRQKLLQKKRICMKGKHGQKDQQTENDIKIKIVDQELKQLQAAMKREEMLKERKARLMEAIERQNRISSAKLVDEFITAEKEEDGEKRREDAEEKEEEARLRETKARSMEEEESTDKEENDDEPFNIDLDPEIEALMAEYQISPTSSQKERMLNEIAASVVQDEKTRAEKVKSFMRKTFSRQRNKVTPL